MLLFSVRWFIRIINLIKEVKLLKRMIETAVENNYPVAGNPYPL